MAVEPFDPVGDLVKHKYGMEGRNASPWTGSMTKILQPYKRLPALSDFEKQCRKQGIHIPNWTQVHQVIYATSRSDQMNYCGIIAYDPEQDHLPATPATGSTSTANFNQTPCYGSFVATGIAAARDASLLNGTTYSDANLSKKTLYAQNRCAVQMHNQTSVPIKIEVYKVTIQEDFSWDAFKAATNDACTFDYPDNYLQELIGDCYSITNSGWGGFNSGSSPDGTYGTGQFADAVGNHCSFKYEIDPTFTNANLMSKLAHSTPSVTNNDGWLNVGNKNAAGVVPAALFARADVPFKAMIKDHHNKLVYQTADTFGLRQGADGNKNVFLGKNTLEKVTDIILPVQGTSVFRFPLKKEGTYTHDRMNWYKYDTFTEGTSGASATVLPITASRYIGKTQGNSFYVFRSFGDKVYDSSASASVTGCASPLVDFKFVKSCSFKVQATDVPFYSKNFQAIPTGVPVADQAHYSFENHTSVGLNHFGDMVAPAMVD